MRKIPKFDLAAYGAEILEQQITPLDPVSWAKKKAGIEFWSKQREICRSVEENRLTAVQSGHGVGKSFTVSALAAWWVDTHPPEETMVVSTAPSSRQVSVIMWEGIRGIHRRAGLRGEVQRADRWLIDDIEVGFGRKPQDYDQYAFQGIHRKYVLVIIDEAGGIDEWLWIAALAISTGRHCRIIAIGNPEDPTSYFAKVCKPGSGWNKIQISIFDSPNFTGEKISEDAKEKLTDVSYVEDMRREVGEDTPMWKAKVLGEFPDTDEFSVIPLAWVTAAQERWKEWDEGGRFLPGNARHIVGADIARFGGDKSAFAHKYAHVVERVDVLPGMDTETTADLLLNSMTGSSDMAVVDTNGVGAGVYDKVKRAGRSAYPLNVANRTSLKDSTGQIEFYNLRSAAMWKLREALNPAKGSIMCIPPGDKIAAQLSAPRWKNIAGGKMVIEEKTEIRKRIGSSPDAADAIILANYFAAEDVDDYGNSGAIAWNSDPDPHMDGAAIDWEEDEDGWRSMNIA